jgi:hypothetical protein
MPWLLGISMAAGCGGTSSGSGAHGQEDNGGKHPTGDSGAEAACKSTSLAVAPIECLDEDWSHAVQTYPRTCPIALGAYRASCGAYDTVVVHGPAKDTFCFYSRGTGALTASEQVASGRSTCLTFDFDFAPPDTSACTPVGGASCVDAGTP